MAKTGLAAAMMAIITTGASAPARAGGLPLLSGSIDASRLPRPIGINLTLYHQNQDYAVRDLSFSVPGISVDPGALRVDNALDEVNLKLDAWIFPFLDVFALLGQIDATTTVDFSGVPLPVPLSSVVIRYDGDVYGAGMTVAAGTERFFGSLTGIYTETDLGSNFDSDVTAFVLSPRIGVIQGKASFWVGATYQDAQEKHAGTVGIPIFGQVDFRVRLHEADPWNLQVGMQAPLGEHWYLEIECGAAERLSTSLGLTYRF